MNRFGPYFVSPVVVGLDKVGEDEWKPVIATYDSIGTLQSSGQVECGGTAADFLLGPAETFWKPDLGPEELYEVVANSLLAGIGRDSLSGWGAYIYILTPDGVTVRSLQTR